MGTISTGVGLMSGLDIQGLVEQLMAIEARPQKYLKQRVETLVSQRTAFLQLSAQILAVKSAAARFDEADFFKRAKATSSDENVIVATASEGALAGSYPFSVQSLVATHQMISSGFATADSTPVGVGTITLESAKARLAPPTALDSLNGGSGVRRGAIRITDRSGASAEIDLSSALTIDDVVEAINGQVSVNVTASVSGGHLVLTDHTGQTTGSLTVQEVEGGHTAADLGLLVSAAANVLTGRELVYLTEDTLLSSLNDGNGVRRDGVLDDLQIQLRDGSTIDVSLSNNLRSETRLAALNGGAGVRLGTIRITNRAGDSADVDLTGATTIQDIQSSISDAGLDLSVTLINSYLLITDKSGSEDSEGTLKIEDVGGGFAARDLGIAQEVEGASLTGADIYGVRTLGDVLRAINLDSENTGALVAAISDDGYGITLTDTSVGTGTTTVVALQDPLGNDSGAAEDLGILTASGTGTIASRHLIAGLETVLLRSLNGGRGVDQGIILLTARDGTETQIELIGLNTLSEVIEAINALSETSKISAAINAAGNGIVLKDFSPGTGALDVADLAGSTAQDLGIYGSVMADTLDGGNLQRQYISATTRLEDLNAGRGIARGTFTITDSSGARATVDLTQGNEVTLADVIREIKTRGIGVEASINATGDGLLLTDTAGGAGRLTVVDGGAGTAADLNIAGTADEGQTTIDGSFEIHIEVDPGEGLNAVASKINGARAGVSASVLSDGSSTNPYRLLLASELSGSRGEMMVDTGGLDLSFSTLVEARDAVVFLGDPGSSSSLMLTSSTNTLDGVVPNVTIDLLATSSAPVQVSVAPDVEGLVTDMKTFVTTFNTVLDSMDELTAFDAKTGERAVLTGDSTVQRIRNRLYGIVRHAVTTGGVYDRLNDVGLSLRNGARLQFDEDRFRQAMAENPQDVQALFTQAETGLGAIIDEELTALTESGSGLIDRHNEAIRSQEELLNDRIAAMQVLLDAKEQRLLNQFYAMEEALARLDAQQSALSGLQTLVSSLGSIRSSRST